jgi:hypothetical protein
MVNVSQITMKLNLNLHIIMIEQNKLVKTRKKSKIYSYTCNIITY